MKFTQIPLLLSLMAGASHAQTFVADFNQKELVHGKILTGDEYDSGPGGGFTFKVETGNGLNTAIIFDTNETGTADPDLEFPFSGGNLAGSRLNQILIFADNLGGSEKDGIVDQPNDSAAGGVFNLSFNDKQTSAFGFALVDAPEKEESFGIAFTDSNGKSVKLNLEEFLKVSNTTDFEGGDNFANQFNMTRARDLGLANIKEVSINLKASGGIDNLTWTVPEPTSALLSLVGLGFLAGRRR